MTNYFDNSYASQLPPNGNFCLKVNHLVEMPGNIEKVVIALVATCILYFSEMKSHLCSNVENHNRKYTADVAPTMKILFQCIAAVFARKLV